MRKMNRESSVPIAFYLWSVGVIILIIISVLFLTVFYFISNSIVESNVLYTTQVFNRFENQITTKSELTENLLKSISFNRVVTKYLIEKDSSKKIQEIQEIDNLVLNVMGIEPFIQQVIVEGKNGVVYCSNGRDKNVMEALKNISKQPNNEYDFSQKVHYGNSTKESFLLSTTIYDIWGLTHQYYIGRVTMVIDLDILGVTEFNDKYDTSLFLLDNNHNVISANKTIDNISSIINKVNFFTKDSANEILVKDEPYIINHNKISAIGAVCVSATPKKNTVEELNWMKMMVFYMLVIALSMIVAILAYLKYKITAPLKKFSTYMVEIQNETVRYLKKEISLSGYREIQEISKEFNNMIEQINLLTHKLVNATSTLYEAELQKKQSELLHLRSQINPHFLYNTLEGILGMSYIENAPKTGNMIKCLSKIFKYSVKGDDTVSVSEELNIIRAYVSIQQIRFSNMFDVFYKFDDKTLEYKIPKMILQPLVENAIIHGLEGKGAQGNLWIGGKLQDDSSLLIWVEDDGVGLDNEKLEYFNSIIICPNTTRKTDSIGLENVINRIQLTYGQKSQIHIYSQKNVGSRIEIVIPLQ